jgi:hypothetical protein
VSERTRELVAYGDHVVLVLPLSDAKVLAVLLKDAEADSLRLNGAGLRSEVRQLVRFILDAPARGALTQRLMRQVRIGAYDDPQSPQGLRTAASVAVATADTLDTMTAKDIRALAADRGATVSVAHVRRCLEPVAKIGQENRYDRADAHDFIEGLGHK